MDQKLIYALPFNTVESGGSGGSGEVEKWRSGEVEQQMAVPAGIRVSLSVRLRAPS
jgi:hypothetical protein